MSYRATAPESETIPYSTDPSVVAGFLFKLGRHWYIESLRSYGDRIRVEPRKDLVVGALAEVRLGPEETGPFATVLRVIPCEREDERAIQGILTLYQAPTTWTNRREIQDVPKSVDKEALEGRVDLRHLPFVTIDGESALDFDDAVFAEAATDNGYSLSVAIADVSHYVREDSLCDLDARERGNSIYLPDFVVPMLPEELSNGICSLNPEVDRLAVVCKMILDSRGKVMRHEFCDAVIRSRARLTYSEVAAYGRQGLPGRSKAVRKNVRCLFEVRDLLHAQREARGALDFDLPESTVRLDESGNPVGVVVEERNEAHELIEQAMIAANVAAAEYLLDRKKRPIFRVHDKPNIDALQDLSSDLREIGLTEIPALDEPKGIRKLLHALRNKRLFPRVWEMRVLRTMTQACYSVANHGHFGLALHNYLHFTSPIRRYADLQVHRQIKRCIRGKQQPSEHDAELANIASHITMTERRAAEIERRVSSWLKCTLLKNKENEVFNGTVSGIADFGVFVELDEYLVSGLIHVTTMPEDYYVNLGTAYVGRTTGASYRLGDRLKVRIKQAVVEAGRLDLEDTDANPGTGRKKKRKRRNR